MFDDRSSESALERARWVGFGASGGDGVARKTSPMVARSLRAVSRRPRASTVRRTARTSGAVNSNWASANCGASEAKQPFDLGDCLLCLPLASLLVQQFGGDGVESVGQVRHFGDLGQLLGQG